MKSERPGPGRVRLSDSGDNRERRESSRPSATLTQAQFELFSLCAEFGVQIEAVYEPGCVDWLNTHVSVPRSRAVPELLKAARAGLLIFRACKPWEALKSESRSRRGGVGMSPRRRRKPWRYDPVEPGQLKGLLRRGVTVWYAMTAEGASVWERLARPNWGRYVRVRRDERGTEVVALTQRVARLYVASLRYWGDVLTPGTLREDIIRPWRATYWKTRPKGVRIRFRTSYDPKTSMKLRGWQSMPEEMKALHLRNGWHQGPGQS